MALGTTNISIATVQGAIGVYSTSSLGALIAKAKTGGVGGYAFYIYETRASNGNRYDGVLIPGAEPHWNMWSRYIPAEWVIISGALTLRLKRNALNLNGGYDYRLHDFRLYNHLASRPTLFSENSYINLNGNMTVSWSMFMYEMALPSQITHILAKVVLGGSITQTRLIPLSEITHYTGMPPEIPVQYSVNFSNVVSSSGSIQLFGSNQYGQELCTLTNIYETKGFSIQTIPIVASLQRIVTAPRDQNVALNASITIPTGSSTTIDVAVGVSSIGGYTITIEGVSPTKSDCAFDIYLVHSGQADIKVTSTPHLMLLSSSGRTSTYYVSSVALNAPTAAGDTLSFDIRNLSY